MLIFLFVFSAFSSNIVLNLKHSKFHRYFLKYHETCTINIPQNEQYMVLFDTLDDFDIRVVYYPCEGRSGIFNFANNPKAVGYQFGACGGYISVLATESANLSFITLSSQADCLSIIVSTQPSMFYAVGNDKLANTTCTKNLRVCLWHAVSGPTITTISTYLKFMQPTLELYDGSSLILSAVGKSYQVRELKGPPFAFFHAAYTVGNTWSLNSSSISAFNMSRKTTFSFIANRNCPIEDPTFRRSFRVVPKRTEAHTQTPQRTIEIKITQTPKRKSATPILLPAFSILIATTAFVAIKIMKRPVPDDEISLISNRKAQEDSIPPHAEIN